MDRASTYKFRGDPNLSSDEIKLRVAESKKKRIQDKILREE